MAGVVSKRALHGLVLAIVSWLGTSCSPSEEAIQARFEAFVNTANQCTEASECTIVTPGCPLGCFVSVRADRRAEVEAKAHALVTEYQRWGAHCDYDCAAAGVPTCSDHRCAFAPAP
jgi:hypothetical protein